MEVVLKTHVGHVRQVNEDSAEIFLRDPNLLLAIVADGMGGHQAGDVASQMAIQHFKQAFAEVDSIMNAAGWENWVLQTIHNSNRSIFEMAEQSPSFQGMGTTIVVAIFLEEYYVVAHIGDSRIYRFHRESHPSIESLTEDHSLVNELVRNGQITREQAETHPHRSWITRAVGTEEEVQVDIKTIGYLGNEIILLCSDGLSDYVDEQQIIDLLSLDEELEDKATKLIQTALDAGGDDNITLILVNPVKDQCEQEER